MTKTKITANREQEQRAWHGEYLVRAAGNITVNRRGAAQLVRGDSPKDSYFSSVLLEAMAVFERSEDAITSAIASVRRATELAEYHLLTGMQVDGDHVLSTAKNLAEEAAAREQAAKTIRQLEAAIGFVYAPLHTAMELATFAAARWFAVVPVDPAIALKHDVLANGVTVATFDSENEAWATVASWIEEIAALPVTMNFTED